MIQKTSVRQQVQSVAGNVSIKKFESRNLKNTISRIKEKLSSGRRDTIKTTYKSIYDMMKVIEIKDAYTIEHQKKTAILAKALAKETGLSKTRTTGVYIAALIHDIGKIVIPDKILNKPGPLTKSEFSIIKKHSRAGYAILKDISFPWPVAKIVFQHHERLDGSGYPAGLKGRDILPETKILSIADVVEAMTFKRPYRKALGSAAALEEISKNMGNLYDAKISIACLKLFNKKRFKF